MKNNKGYYSWIHSLNEAAIQSQHKGFEMLKEEKARKITDPHRQAALSGQMQPPPPRTMQGDDVLPIYDKKGRRAEAVRERTAKRAFAAEIIDKQLSKVPGYAINPESITRGRGDPSIHAEITKMKDAELLAHLASFDGPIDAAPVGDANDVEDDAQDGVMADPGIGIGDPSSPLPTYSLAAQARSEHARESYKEASRAARIAARQAASEQEYEEREDARRWSGPTGRTGETYSESVNIKINKLMNEGKIGRDRNIDWKGTGTYKWGQKGFKTGKPLKGYKSGRIDTRDVGYTETRGTADDPVVDFSKGGSVHQNKAWTPSTGGAAIADNEAGDTEIRERMRKIARGGGLFGKGVENTEQSPAYYEMQKELKRREAARSISEVNSENIKHNKLLNEKINDEESDAESGISNIRGTVGVGGDQSIFAAGTYPGGIFNKLKGPRTESAQIKHLIQIVSNPENHPPEHVKYADEFLKAMASHLRGKI